MKKCIIFGAGYYGTEAYYKLKEYYDIIFYVDNNEMIWETRVHDIPVISFEKMLQIYDHENMEIIICCKAYSAIAHQLTMAGIQAYYVMLEGFLYYCDNNEMMMPRELMKIENYIKEKNEKNILFVQNTACIRTHKIATMMKGKGYKVFLLYTIAPPESNNASFIDVYDKIFTVFSPKALVDFVNNSDFDIIHSSNEPDSLTNYLQLTNKKIVFDVHDMLSLMGESSVEALTLEYIANVRSAGVIYTSESVLEIAKAKFGLEKQRTFVLKNLILNRIKVKQAYEKLSSKDGEIHCVYEGGIEGNNKRHLRFFEHIWKKITDCGVHIHYYSQSDYNYCVALEKKSPYLHFEGNVGSEQLAVEMTKYDCGLILLNVNNANRVLLETASPNKVNEYLNSSLPVIVGEVRSLVDFVKEYGVGIHLDLNGDIKKQLQEASKIKIEDDFLEKNKMVMDCYSDELVQFYNSIIGDE